MFLSLNSLQLMGNTFAVVAVLVTIFAFTGLRFMRVNESPPGYRRGARSRKGIHARMQDVRKAQRSSRIPKILDGAADLAKLMWDLTAGPWAGANRWLQFKVNDALQRPARPAKRLMQLAWLLCGAAARLCMGYLETVWALPAGIVALCANGRSRKNPTPPTHEAEVEEDAPAPLSRRERRRIRAEKKRQAHTMRMRMTTAGRIRRNRMQHASQTARVAAKRFDKRFRNADAKLTGLPVWAHAAVRATAAWFMPRMDRAAKGTRGKLAELRNGWRDLLLAFRIEAGDGLESLHGQCNALVPVLAQGGFDQQPSWLWARAMPVAAIALLIGSWALKAVLRVKRMQASIDEMLKLYTALLRQAGKSDSGKRRSQKDSVLRAVRRVFPMRLRNERGELVDIYQHFGSQDRFLALLGAVMQLYQGNIHLTVGELRLLREERVIGGTSLRLFNLRRWFWGVVMRHTIPLVGSKSDWIPRGWNAQSDPEAHRRTVLGTTGGPFWMRIWRLRQRRIEAQREWLRQRSVEWVRRYAMTDFIEPERFDQEIRLMVDLCHDYRSLCMRSEESIYTSEYFFNTGAWHFFYDSNRAASVGRAALQRARRQNTRDYQALTEIARDEHIDNEELGRHWTFISRLVRMVRRFTGRDIPMVALAFRQEMLDAMFSYLYLLRSDENGRQLVPDGLDATETQRLKEEVLYPYWRSRMKSLWRAICLPDQANMPHYAAYRQRMDSAMVLAINAAMAHSEETDPVTGRQRLLCPLERMYLDVWEIAHLTKCFYSEILVMSDRVWEEEVQPMLVRMTGFIQMADLIHQMAGSQSTRIQTTPVEPGFDVPVSLEQARAGAIVAYGQDIALGRLPMMAAA